MIHVAASLEFVIATSNRKTQLDARVIGVTFKFNIATQKQDAIEYNSILLVITFLQNLFIAEKYFFNETCRESNIGETIAL